MEGNNLTSNQRILKVHMNVVPRSSMNTNGEIRHRRPPDSTVTVESTGREFDSHQGQNIFFFTSCGSLIPYTRANAQWVIHGFN